MVKVTLGSTGITVNKNGFGALPIQRISHESSTDILRRAYEAGIDFYDTARFYTDSECKLGEALSDVREHIYIATKTAAKNTSSKSTAAKSKTQGKTAGSAAARKNAGNTGLISDLDCYLFGAGTHYEIYKKLGAHPMTYKGKRASILVYGHHMPRQSIW